MLTEHDVHVLDSLSRGSLNEIVNSRDDNSSAGYSVLHNINITVVTTSDMTSLGETATIEIKYQ